MIDLDTAKLSQLTVPTAGERSSATLRDQAAAEPAFGQSLMAARQRSYSGAMGREDVADLDPADKARKTAEDFVAIAFIQPLLKEFRSSSNAAPPFGPGPAERQFRQITDAQLARDLVHAKRFPMVDSIQQRLLEHQATSLPAPMAIQFGPEIANSSSGLASRSR